MNEVNKEYEKAVLKEIDKWYFETREKKTYVDLSDVGKLKQKISGSEDEYP